MERLFIGRVGHDVFNPILRLSSSCGRGFVRAASRDSGPSDGDPRTSDCAMPFWAPSQRRFPRLWKHRKRMVGKARGLHSSLLTLQADRRRRVGRACRHRRGGRSQWQASRLNAWPVSDLATAEHRLPVHDRWRIAHRVDASRLTRVRLPKIVSGAMPNK